MKQNFSDKKKEPKGQILRRNVRRGHTLQTVYGQKGRDYAEKGRNWN